MLITTLTPRLMLPGLLSGLLLMGCGADEPEAVAPAAPPVRATLTVVEPGTSEVVLDAIGSVESLAQATPATRVSGRVTMVAAHRGQMVAAGQLLIRVDSRDLKQGLARAQAGRDQATAGYRLAQADFDRATALFAEKAIAQQALDRARMARDSAAAALDAANRAIGEAQAHLSYGDVLAPFAGLIIDRRVEVGDLAAPGQPLIILERTDSMKVTVNVAESSALKINTGNAATVSSAGQQWQGTVASIVPTASRQSHAYEVRIVVDNRHGHLRSGQFARARFKTGERRSLFVPRELVVHQGQLRGVFVLTEGRALLRWLRFGVETADAIEVLSGLTAGETLVQPAAGVHDGVAIATSQGA